MIQKLSCTALTAFFLFLWSMPAFGQRTQDAPGTLLGWVQLALEYVALDGPHHSEEGGGVSVFFEEVFDKGAVDSLFVSLGNRAEVWDTVAYYYLDALWNVYVQKDMEKARASCYKAGLTYLDADAGYQYLMEHQGMSFGMINHLREYIDLGKHTSTNYLGFDSATGQQINGYLGYGVTDIRLPSFPWPPPRPSSKCDLPGSYFKSAETLGDMDFILSKALERCGYLEKSYYGLSDSSSGFVLVTRLERFQEDCGKPFEGRDRWNESLQPSTFSFSDYLSALFWGRVGYYRVIAFVFSDGIITPSSNGVSDDEVKGWLSGGANRLPEEIASVSSEGFVCTALVYEFEVKEQCRDASAVSPAKVAARKHLENTGICRFR